MELVCILAHSRKIKKNEILMMWVLAKVLVWAVLTPASL